jgi:ferrochelatase
MAKNHRRKGVMLVNLGSPDSPKPEDVRRYLAEFLDDPRVVDLPTPLRRGVLNLFILPFRPKRSGEAYSTIWTEEGSPLIVISEKVRDLLDERIELPLSLGMRYGNPSIEEAFEELFERGVDDVLLVPLYPHYAMSSYETVVSKARDVLGELGRDDVALTVQPPFYDDPDYVDALVDVAEPYLEGDFDRLLFSYHGIPERHVRKTDPSGNYCMQSEDCCRMENPAHAFCYRHQCFATTWAFAERAGLDEEQYDVSFQSRLGIRPWLQPYTDKTLERLPGQGVKKLLVICPAFVSDCLETLEEIQMEGRETFLDAGGHEFTYIPCLNENPRWIELLERFVATFEEGGLHEHRSTPTASRSVAG